jgi:hypothetical protein
VEIVAREREIEIARSKDRDTLARQKRKGTVRILTLFVLIGRPKESKRERRRRLHGQGRHSKKKQVLRVQIPKSRFLFLRDVVGLRDSEEIFADSHPLFLDATTRALWASVRRMLPHSLVENTCKSILIGKCCGSMNPHQVAYFCRLMKRVSS